MYQTFSVNMESLSSSMISILGLKRVPCLFVNNVNEWDKTLPILPRYISNLIKSNKDVYNVFISNYNTCTIVKHEEKWRTLFNLDDSFCWKAIYNALFKCTKDSKLLWLEYRILHRNLGTHMYLFNCQITNNNKCNLCTTESESIELLVFFTVIRVNNCGCSWNNYKCNISLLSLQYPFFIV